MRSLFLTPLLLLLLLPVCVRSQEKKEKEHPNSSVFKDYRPPNPTQLIHPSDLEYQLWEGFMLVRKANDGDPAAQHELGLRYLLGKGFPTDTIRAAYWIRKAADQNMSIALYNLGVFLNSGWGVPWNPFEAYKRFKAAALRHLPEAEFAVGLFYTDNLVVKRDWTQAYRWIRSAAEAKYEPARQVLQEFVRKGLPIPKDTTSIVEAIPDSSAATPVQPLEPVYLDFGTDTSSRVDDLTLLNEAFHEGNEEFRKAIGVSKMFEKNDEKDSTGFSLLVRAADVGSPEALTVLGRCYERGIGVSRDRILAAEMYLRAIRIDSRRAPAFLWQTAHEKGFPEEVEARARRGNDDAAFVWAGLTALGFDQRILPEQAFRLLVTAANRGNVPSLIETGLCYFSGRWTTKDPAKGEQYWRRAAQRGSREAIIRLAAASVFADSSNLLASHESDIETLTSAANDGSMIGQLALGFCFERGIGVPQNIPESVKYYRNCAQRGSSSAYAALERMYDRIRPKEKEFEVAERTDNSE